LLRFFPPGYGPAFSPRARCIVPSAPFSETVFHRSLRPVPTANSQRTLAFSSADSTTAFHRLASSPPRISKARPFFTLYVIGSFKPLLATALAIPSATTVPSPVSSIMECATSPHSGSGDMTSPGALWGTITSADRFLIENETSVPFCGCYTDSICFSCYRAEFRCSLFCFNEIVIIDAPGAHFFFNGRDSTLVTLHDARGICVCESMSKIHLSFYDKDLGLFHERCNM